MEREERKGVVCWVVNFISHLGPFVLIRCWPKENSREAIRDN